MAKERPAAVAAAPVVAPRDLPSHIILLADWGGHLAGRVLRADAEFLAMLDAEHAKYRAATEMEVSIGANGG